MATWTRWKIPYYHSNKTLLLKFYNVYVARERGIDGAVKKLPYNANL